MDLHTSKRQRCDSKTPWAASRVYPLASPQEAISHLVVLVITHCCSNHQDSLTQLELAELSESQVQLQCQSDRVISIIL